MTKVVLTFLLNKKTFKNKLDKPFEISFKLYIKRNLDDQMHGIETIQNAFINFTSSPITNSIFQCIENKAVIKY